MASADSLASLFVGKFADLKEYFTGLTREDLRGIDEEEIISGVQHKHKLLMRVFIKQHLHSFTHDESAGNPYAPAVISRPHVPFVDLRRCLVLRGVVTSIAIPNLPKGTSSSKELAGAVLSAALSGGKNAADIQSVDLTFCNLFDVDVSNVEELLRALPNCTEVNLAHNRLYGKDGTPGGSSTLDEKIHRLLGMDNGLTVNICGNRLASIDRMDFFSSLSDEELRRLIWIPREWLTVPSNSGWKAMLPDDEKRSLVKVTHDAYYSQPRDA